MTDRDFGIQLLRAARDRGITFFDTAPAYGDGYGETILAEAFNPAELGELVIGTKFGYDLNAPRQGHRERPHDWSPRGISKACDLSLQRLNIDCIDLYQMHNPRLDAIRRDDTFEQLERLKSEGKIRHYAVAVGPDLGWQDEGIAAVSERRVPVQIIYSILEQDPARAILDAAQENDVGVFTRVPHASGMLDGTYTKDTVLDDSPFSSSGPPFVSQVDVDTIDDWQACQHRFLGEELRRNYRPIGDPFLPHARCRRLVHTYNHEFRDVG